MSDPNQYTVGWICALETEYVAARAFLEKKHPRPETLSPNDNNHYTLGEIAGHRVVIAGLPDGEYGISSAAGVARDMVHSFPNIRFGLMVGIGGGVPTKHDIRLGDVIVSSSRNGRGGLLQYDLGKELQGQKFYHTGFLNQPPPILRTAVAGLQAQYEEEGHQLKASVQAVLEGNKRLKRKYTQPPFEADRLFESQFAHPNSQENCGEICDSSKLIYRPKRTDEEDDPAIYYGLIASGNRVIKDAIFRDKLAVEEDILCFEMEAAGLMNHFPCLVIRGVCDYADSHKSKEWQGWAAMMAAAYARDLLYQIVPQRLKAERKASEILDGIKSQLANVSEDIHNLRSITSGSAQEIHALAESIDLKELPVAAEAEFGTYMDQHEEECLPGTRKELLLDIQDWAASDQGKCIFWLNGLAGTGKSTISRTIAKAFQKQGLLGASFFFKRGEGDRGNAARFFPTIIQQLFTRIPEVRAAILQAIRDNPRISAKPLKEQFEELIHKPLHSLNQSKLQSSRLVIVVDALDECDHDNDIQVILQLMPRVQEVNSLCLRFFITSRPELPIRLGFTTIDHRDLVLHEVPKPIIERDIFMFLDDKLVLIRHKRSLSSDWPGYVNVQILVTMSVPLFIFAATICRLLEDYNLDPEQCLTEILKYQNQESKLDGTYLPVLDRLASKYSGARQKQLVQEVREVVGTIILLESPLSVTSLSKLMGISTQSIHARLNSLHSVLYIPNNDMLPVRLFHQSFRDFLLDLSTRDKTPFWIDEKGMNQMLFTLCLSVMRKYLKKNICSLESYGTKRSDINPESIDHYLLPELQDLRVEEYWDPEMQTLEGHSDLVSSVAFSGDGQLLASGSYDETIKLWDAATGAFKYILEDHSGPVDSVAFSGDGQLLASGSHDDIIKLWDAATGTLKYTLEDYSSLVYSVIFSGDGQLLASGLHDKTIKLWDAATGTLKHILEGYSGLVDSVAFSGDGQLLASSSDDNTIKLWDTATGALKHILEDYFDLVSSVAFSGDGQLLASGSYDDTIKLWDAATGALKYILKSHSGPVYSVAFSGDGQLLASGSYDKTIKLWDAAMGAFKYTLEDYSDLVSSVAFSGDGQLLASGLDDDTIKLWNAATGALKYTLEDYSSPINSVAFSGDGQLLASSSYDDIIKLWDAATGALKYTLEGYSDLIYSVAFSGDGQLLASGSHDKTIKLWNTATGAFKHTLEGYSSLVYSVVFSGDGQLLVSGSYDKTIKLWDAATGAFKHDISTDDVATDVGFSEHLPLLITNIGSFDI
ncbi:hypothetical protein AnigIFM59636_012026 [Aspergillus niger]|nr:hypothetical protein AnigIFM59636_012026 [Aspergillus niger]